MKTTINSQKMLNLITKHSPDMLWIKDLKNCYLYANDNMCREFLFATQEEVLGRDDYYFSNIQKNRYPENENWYSFGELCSSSDIEVLKEEKAVRFEESGYVHGKKVYLEVDKAPFYDEDGKLIGTIGVGRDVTQKVLLEEKNRVLMYFDQLTKLPNRQKIILDIKNLKPKSAIVLNIDDFKEINDFFGTSNADKILQDIAQRFIDLKYTAYRIDGDEFAILFFDDININELLFETKELLKKLDEEPFYIDDKTILVTFSAGIAKSDENLLTKVDIAVNNAKKLNNHICVYEESQNIEERYKENIELATSIKEAILENRIVCHYQPLLNIETSEIYAYESLVRMIDKNDNSIAPYQFLDFSKKIKLYSNITKIVVSEACKTFQNRDENFSINLSVDDIKDSSTVEFILKTIKETNTSSRVTFEILESEGIENYNEVISFINQIKVLGARIAIDDFGTGYSNFEHLLRLDVDYIKIDGSLIKNIVTDFKHRLIVETIVSFAKRIGIKTVAEFVSDDEILKTIKEIGISCAQGYHIGKPEAL